MSNIHITPNDIEKALRIARPEYRRMHEMNIDHPSIRGCKLGTVFTAGENNEYHIYVGVNGRNRKYPAIAYRVRDWSCRKFTSHVFEKIRKAS